MQWQSQGSKRGCRCSSMSCRRGDLYVLRVLWYSVGMGKDEQNLEFQGLEYFGRVRASTMEVGNLGGHLGSPMTALRSRQRRQERGRCILYMQSVSQFDSVAVIKAGLECRTYIRMHPWSYVRRRNGVKRNEGQSKE